MVTRQQLAQGQVWWVSLAEPVGSAPGYRVPVVVVQGNRFNRSRIATVVVVPITRTLRLADQPGNVLIHAIDSGLPSDSVANVSQILTIDRTQLDELVSHLADRLLDQILFGIQLMLER